MHIRADCLDMRVFLNFEDLSLAKTVTPSHAFNPTESKIDFDSKV